MATRYAIWDKTSTIITPVGEVFTPAQWIERYPAAAQITYVCAAGEINGGFFQSLSSLVAIYQSAGADFSGAMTNEEKLNVIEAFEDAINAESAEAAAQPSAEERSAAALEFIAMSNLPDEEA